jgi:hypothetical protein
MPGGELSHWPLCAVCSERCCEPTVVEEYEVPPGDCKRDGNGRITRVVVVARCSHGRGFKPGTIREQRAGFDVPEWWGNAHVDDAVRSLIFFAPGHGAPAHTLVTHIGNG